MIPVAPALTLHLEGPQAGEALADGTDLGLTVQQLVAYAQRGEMVDWPDASGAIDAFQGVCSALYACPGQPGEFGLGELQEEADVATPLGVALVAAYGRAQINLRRPATAKMVAVLAGVTARAVQKTDDLPVLDLSEKPWRIPAADAARWLGARGVPGFRG